jgi:hypothetical protein
VPQCADPDTGDAFIDAHDTIFRGSYLRATWAR